MKPVIVSFSLVLRGRVDVSAPERGDSQASISGATKHRDGVNCHSTEDGDGLTSIGKCENISQLLWETRGQKNLPIFGITFRR